MYSISNVMKKHFEPSCYLNFRHRPALGECVASFASTFPVAFLEPTLNMYNKNSILYNIPEEQIATHSLEAKGKISDWSVFFF